MQNRKKSFSFLILAFIATLLLCISVFGQTTAFNFQGRLNDGGNPANGNYEMQFKLFDALTGGTQIGATVTDPSVAVINGSFTAVLDFGAAAFNTGADRYLEIGVRPMGNPNPFTILSPLQPIKSTPYSIQAKNAATADTATNALQLGGIAASEYVTTSSVGNSFIKNTTMQQTGANFNISGNGFFGGNVGIGTFNPATKLEVKTPTGAYGFTQTDGTVSVGSFISTQGGWFGTKSNHPLYFFTNDSGFTMAINTIGNVGIGTTTPNARLQVVGANNDVGIFSQANATGVQGTSAIGVGVVGSSTSGQGIIGLSTSSFGVKGRTNVANTSTIAGVFGESTGSGGIGVIGEANVGSNAFGVFGKSTNGYGVVGNSTSNQAVTGISTTGRGVVGTSVSFDGVYGETSSSTGSGVSARNTGGGLAMYADGNVQQVRDKGGWVKAMVYVNEDGTIARCFNAVTNSSTGNCGFTMDHSRLGSYKIDFGLQVNDRFYSLTTGQTSGLTALHALFGIDGCLPGNLLNQVCVLTSYSDTRVFGYTNAPFMLIVY